MSVSLNDGRLAEVHRLMRPKTRYTISVCADEIAPERALITLTARDDLPHGRAERLVLSLSASQLRQLGDEFHAATAVIDSERARIMRMVWIAAGTALALGLIAQVFA